MKDFTVIPEICVDDARGAIAYYKKAFGAKDLGTHATPDGKRIMHSALALNDGVVFVRDDFPERNRGKARTPKALGASSVTIHLNCADAHRVWKKAVQAGATVVMPLEQQFWGDVYGVFDDPFGQRWSMSAAHSEKPDVESPEYKAGAEALYPTGKQAPRAGKKSAKKAAKKTRARGRPGSGAGGRASRDAR
jgi:PhnB protein